jgi:hypothetical protein
MTWTCRAACASSARRPRGGQIKDLSIGGCRIHHTDLPKHAEIWVTLGNAQPMRARVVWVGSGEAGCEFYAPLSRAALRAIMLSGRPEAAMQPRRARAVLCIMTDDDKRPEGATNDRPLNETIAGTGPGIPDEALGPGQELPDAADR